MERRDTVKLLVGAATVSPFEAYGEHILFTGLHTGQQLIKDEGSQLLFLPAFSPDFSPGEETFSKVKAFLSRTEAPQEAHHSSFTQAYPMSDFVVYA